MISFADLRGAELYALRKDSFAKTVHCAFRIADGSDAVLLLSGVTQLRCTDFGTKNVVFELVGTPWEKLDPLSLLAYVNWFFGATESEHLVKPEEFESVMRDLLEGRSHGVFLIPSLGGQLGAVATKVELQRWVGSANRPLAGEQLRAPAQYRAALEP